MKWEGRREELEQKWRTELEKNEQQWEERDGERVGRQERGARTEVED